MSELRRAAYHEAGHAVIGIALGFKLIRVLLSPPRTRFAGAPLTGDSLKRFAVRCLAGPAAETLFFGDCIEGARGDERMIDEIRHRLDVVTIAAASAEARDLVARHRARIDLVADELRRRKVFTGADVMALLWSPDRVLMLDHV